MLGICRSIGCTNQLHNPKEDFCEECISFNSTTAEIQPEETETAQTHEPSSMAEKYPEYYKPVGNLTEVDVYAVHYLFNIQDPSGAIQHASKKLLLSGVRTGGKSKYDDVREARDTLTRWMQLHDAIQ